MVWHSGSSLLDPADAFERLEAEAAVVLVAGADGEGQRIEEQVARRRGRTCSTARSWMRRAMASLRSAVLAMASLVFVDGAGRRRPRRTCGTGAARRRSVSSPSSRLTRVDDALAAGELEAGLDDRRARSSRS